MKQQKNNHTNIFKKNKTRISAGLAAMLFTFTGSGYLEKELNQDNEAPSPESSLVTLQPQESENPQHIFTTWQESGSKETRTCVDCSLQEERNHTLYKIVSYQGLEDGKHYKISKVACSTCDYEELTTIVENCTYTAIFDSSGHIQTCKQCEFSKTANHTLVKNINPDESTIYSCTQEGCQYTNKTNPLPSLKSIDHTHDFVNNKEVVNLQNGTHANRTISTCNICGKKVILQEETVSCTYGPPITTYVDLEDDLHTYTTIEKCTECKHMNITNGSQEHEYISKTDLYGNEVLECQKCLHQKTLIGNKEFPKTLINKPKKQNNHN